VIRPADRIAVELAAGERRRLEPVWAGRVSLKAMEADRGLTRCLRPPTSMVHYYDLDSICVEEYWDLAVVWDVAFHDDFAVEFLALDTEVRVELAARITLLRQFGPHLRRPHADTLSGSRHANMKELRFDAANGVWRVAYAFDPARQAILLVAGDKSGQSSARFYRQLIAKADARLDDHLTRHRKGGR
jgi:hypothetical protein